MNYKLKFAIARCMDQIGVSSIGESALKALYKGRFVRVVNYHATPLANASGLEEQLRYFREHYQPMCPEDLPAFLDGQWRGDMPGIILTFDDGLRSNFDIAKPLLERHGFRGVFFVCPGLVGQRDSKRGEFYMDRDAVVALRERHFVGCHTLSHRRLSEDLDATEVQREVVESKARLEEILSAEVDSFCWVGGEEYAYSAAAADAIRRAGYRYAYMTNCLPLLSGADPLQIQRTNVESHWLLSEVRFYLSGLMDLYYFPKRRRVARKVAKPKM